MEEQEPQYPILEQEPKGTTEEAILQISKWTRLIASIGFAIGAFIVMIMLINGAQILRQFANALPIKAESIYTALVAGFFILFFIAALILYCLHKASQLLLRGVQQKDNTALMQGFIHLRNFFIATGILSLVQLLINLSNLL